MRPHALALIAVIAMSVSFAPAQTTGPAKNGPAEEHAPDGKLLAKGAYKDGLKTGKWTTFNDAGKPADDAIYLNGKLVGARTFYWPNGKTRATVPYRDGAVSGQVLTFDDAGKRLLLLNYPRPLAAIKKAWSELYPYEPMKPVYDTEPLLDPPYKAGVLKKEVTDQALKFLKLYRFLANQPYENITVDTSLNALCSAGSVLLHKHGSLSHFPPKPADMPDAFFAVGAEGCAHSNIYMSGGGGTVIDSLRAYMDDSDNSNVSKVGHRQWLLNPKMTRTGFGFAAGFSETYSHGQALNMQVAERYHVFPGEGYYPEELVGENYAWSFHYNPAQVAIPKRDALKVSVQRLADDFSVAEEIPAEIVNLFTEGNWPSPTLIFRPKWKKFAPARYAVTIAGIQTKANDTAITYVVDFVSMADVKQSVPATRPAAMPPKP
jgi:hypothetical protein